MRTKKIFVGGLSATTSLEDIKAYFEQFSRVKESMLAYDKVSGIDNFSLVQIIFTYFLFLCVKPKPPYSSSGAADPAIILIYKDSNDEFDIKNVLFYVLNDRVLKLIIIYFFF